MRFQREKDLTWKTLSDTLWQAATIMLTGMVVVFVFLSLLIVLVTVMSKWLAPKAEDLEASPTAPPADPAPLVSPDTVAAITSAVAQYRQRHLSK